MPTDDVNPFNHLSQAAIATHELFMAYMDAGFTEDQALKLLIGHFAMATPPPDQQLPPTE